jgi:quinol-cytochrome oxidoreductase complex cytochrome b subunit
MRVVRRILVGLVLIAAVVVGASGAWLAVFWRPRAVWPGDVAGFDTLLLARTLHRVGAWCLILAVLALGTEVAVRAAARGLRRLFLALGTVSVAVLALLGAFATGFLLPWDQLALFAVRGPVWGLRGPFDSQVRLVLVGGAEVSPAAYRTVAVLHVIVFPVLAAPALFVALRSARARRARDNDADQRPDPDSSARYATGVATPSTSD